MTRIGVAGLALLLIVPAISLSPHVAAQEAREKPAAKESYVVVQLGAELRVAAASEVKGLRAQAKKDYLDALQRHKQGKQQAAKSGEKFEEPKPKQAAFKVVAKAPTQEAAEEARQKLLARRDKRSTQKFALVLVGENYRVVPAGEVSQLKKAASADFKQAVADWDTARKEAARNKEPFDQPKPKKPTVKVVKSNFASEDDARAHQEKVQSGAKRGD